METWSQLVFEFVSGRAGGVRGEQSRTDPEEPRRT
jgi:hypothetical protein